MLAERRICWRKRNLLRVQLLQPLDRVPNLAEAVVRKRKEIAYRVRGDWMIIAAQ